MDATAHGLLLPPLLKSAVQRKFPILLLIDVGGSLLYRSGERLPLEKRESDCFCQIMKHYHYYRPQVQHLIASLITHPRVSLAFNTSISRTKALTLVHKILDMKELQPDRALKFEIFDQSYQVPDDGPKGYETKRSLERVFDHPMCQAKGFGLHNTLMIDSDSRKVRDYKTNSLVIKAYTLEQVMAPSDDQTEILTQVRDYVLKMLDEVEEDVREFLAQHRPEFSSRDELA